VVPVALSKRANSAWYEVGAPATLAATAAFSNVSCQLRRVAGSRAGSPRAGRPGRWRHDAASAPTPGAPRRPDR
jgi:hypothetical protein